MQADKRILLIHYDENITVHLREKLIVDGGFFVISESSARRGLETFKKNKFDLVLACFAMPDLKGEMLVRELKAIAPECVVIIFVEDNNPKILKDAYFMGVYDVIAKPINFDRVLFLIKKGIDLYALSSSHQRTNYILHEQNLTLQKQNTILAKRIEESTKNLTKLYEDLRTTYLRTIKALAQAIDARDHYTHSHSENVSRYAVAIAKEMGLSIEDVETVRQASELHDLGKIGIEDKVLLKPASLTNEEFGLIKKHPITGAQILEPLTFLSGVVDLVLYHHEHFDGTGYPEGKKGEDIPIGARILHLADAYDAMISARAYRKVPLLREEAITEIKKNSNTQFDPKVVEVFLRIADKL